MNEVIEPIASMAAELNRLPGIGKKTAQRLAYFIASMPIEDVRSLSVALWEGRKAIRFCSVCGNYAASDTCAPFMGAPAASAIPLPAARKFHDAL